MKKILFALLTAAILCTGVNAAFEKVNTYDNSFSDVKDTNWFAANVKSAYELGFMNGKSEGKFDPNGSVTVAEAITMASRVHAIYSGNEITKKAVPNGEVLRFDFNDMEGITTYYSSGEIQDGVLVLTAGEPNKNGVYDPGVYLNDLGLKAKDCDKLVVRMKRDVLPNVDPNKSRNETLQVYFQTSNDLKISGDRVSYFKLKNLGGEEVLTNWFEIEIPMSSNELWKDEITKIRFDTTDNNGIYYIDYISFCKDAEAAPKNEKWYDMYVDYALDNKIVNKGDYSEADYARNATRAELCWLFAAALPEEYFTPINNVTAIPDMYKNDYYADIILMLYRAGVVLGDAEGNFNASSDIKRSETAAIINRVALSENRVKGEITADWNGLYYIHDLEFDNPEDIEKVFVSDANAQIVDGHLVLVPIERPADRPPKFDPQVGQYDVKIKADEYATLKVRMKLDIEGEVSSMKGEFYYKPEGVEKFGEENSLRPRPDFDSNYYVDAAGWRVYTFYLGTLDTWKGNINAFRFDPTNNGGVFTIDYIRFIRNESTLQISDEELASNYNARTLIDDAGFENGFNVYTPGDRITQIGKGEFEGTWIYNESGEKPLWKLGPWWTNHKFLENRDETTDKYTLADKQGTKSVTVNPEDKALIMSLDTEKILGGKGNANGEMWPHLLVEQINYEEKWANVPEDKKAVLDLDADKVYLEMDIRLNDYVDLDTKNKAEGFKSVVQYNVFLYVAHKDVPGFRTYFGMNLIDNRGHKKNIDFWKDGYSVYMIYTLPTADIFGGADKTFYNEDGTLDVDEWKHIKLDITPYLEDLAAKLTKEDTLGRSVSREDFWFSGLNIGYEVWGNYQVEVEAKNFNVTCYDKK